MADALIEHIPVEARLELRTVVGLDLLDLERKPGPDVIEELDCGLLIRSRIGAKYSQPGAVVDGGSLVLALSAARCSRDWFNELNVNLHVMVGTLLLVVLPAPGMPLVAL